MSPMNGNEPWDVIVIGAGAAGMMCAAQAGQRGRKVLLIDHGRKLAEKIRISGGGHCNFTNLHCGPDNYLSRNPHFCRSALARFTPQHFIALVERYGIRYHEKTLGQLFCEGSAQQIIALLRSECERGQVDWRMPCEVQAVGRNGEGFQVTTSHGHYQSRALVMATGGLAVPAVGSTPMAYQIAEQFGLAVIPPRPALVPLALEPETLKQFGDLSGLSLEVEVSCRKGRFREALLFTHQGISGPAVLQISSYWQNGDFLSIDLLPGKNAETWLRDHGSSRVRIDNFLAELLPHRFARQWCAAHDLSKPLCQFTPPELRKLGEALNNWRIRPSGTLGYNKAEVTLGGVATEDLSSRTMESRSVPGLYFIGEAVDVTGHLGGFNFQWAWASGNAAGQAV
ncbi:NAD(P)/FAD-dependent oxidoreductase [Ferrovum sp.]|uniref:NAD(P)/FAD-dependent oxidoreductase n=1 Tax=Ferrovum sp. TaxID=2609467 RepID=UPI0026276D17|nr:NAD(P)/FAD-dependent oxidoreductase [Ferrovum sp.]